MKLQWEESQPVTTFRVPGVTLQKKLTSCAELNIITLFFHYYYFGASAAEEKEPVGIHSILVSYPSVLVQGT